MKGFRCWNAESVRHTVYSDIGMLPSGADAVFLGAHTTMDLQHPHGVELPDGGVGEHRVLVSLLAEIGDTDRNTLIAVTGKAGTGKSHVVRWVHAHLDPDDSRYHLLYVPRAVQTLRDLLRRIVDGLPGEGGQELLGRIDSAVGTRAPEELRDRLLEEMRLALTWTIDDRLPVDDETRDERDIREEWNSLLGDRDEAGKRRNGLADLLSFAPVNRTLLRTGGHLDRVVHSVLGETSRRDEDQDGFTTDDLPLREAGVRRALTGNADLRELWDIVRRDPRPALDLLRRALKIAVPRTVGARSDSGATLDLLFRTSRRALHQDGRELMLVFEDLAQFGLIDGELYDQFVTQPGTDLAPVRALFAVTDGPFNDLPVSVQERITHRFTVGSSALANRNAFVARYLNLVRVGRDSVEAAWSRARSEEGGEQWMSNACDTREDGKPCRVRDECHSGFGTVDLPDLGAVGLYPYNEVALRRALDGRGPDPTPRQVLNVCVADALVEADTHIERGDYPHARLVERSDFRVRLGKDVVLDGQTGERAERLYRALVLWGDENPLPQAVLDAFSLTGPAGGPVSSRPSITPSSAGPAEKELEASPLGPLLQWQNSERLPDEDANRYRSILHRLVLARLDLDLDLVHVHGGIGQTILNRLFSMRSFKLADARGQGAGPSSIQIDLFPTSEDVRVLIGAQWYVDHHHWVPEDGAWPWPVGYDPVDLMLALEVRLDDWAAQVRRRFRDEVREGRTAGAAVGTRAIALLACGVPSDRLQDVDSVLGGTAAQLGPSTPQWDRVDQTARDIVNRFPAADIVGNLAAVRQGPTGGPQLVDATGLESSLQQFLESPTTNLRTVAEEFAQVEPRLGEAAKNLLDSFDLHAMNLVDEVAAAVGALGTGLEGQPPSAVAKAAREVGQRARDSGLFRPSDGWSTFVGALETLAAFPAGTPLDWRRPTPEHAADEALAVQHWARFAVPAARALEQVKGAMAATLQVCRRGGGAVDDLEQSRQEIRSRLFEAQQHLEALSAAEPASE